MNASGALRFALRTLYRDWRAGELRILAIAIMLAVASATSVGFFTDRVRLAVGQQAAEVLAADLVLTSPRPIAPASAARARALGLSAARTLGFGSVALAGENMQLVEVKAVGPGYPLRGHLRVAEAPFRPGRITDTIPGPGHVWVQARLLPLLGVAVGDDLSLGASRLKITRVLTEEPDRGGLLFNIAPSVMMNLADVPATGLIQPGSRATYELLLAGPPAALAAYRAWQRPRLAADERLQGLSDARPELTAAIDRAGRFLGLAALVGVVLAGVAVAISARRYAARHLDASAIMRCLGAGQRTILQVYTLELLLLGLAASLAGCAAGYAAQAVLARILAGLFSGALPPPSWVPAVAGLATGLVVLLGFALPPLAALRHVPPVRVLRRSLGPTSARTWSAYASAIAAIALLALWQTGDVRLVGYLGLGAALTLALLAGTALALVRALAPLRLRVGVAGRFGLANVARRARGSVVQIVALGLGIMALLLLSLVRGELLAGWERSLPPDAPNQFLINIQPDQVDTLGRFLSRNGIGAATLYPMVRGRWVALNGRPVHPEAYTDPRARRFATREFNLSWAAQPQADNHVVAGRWWTPAERGRPLMSLEQGFARTLGLKLGDRMSFSVAGRELTVTVSNLRTVDWDSFRVNFFAVVPPGVLEGYPATWITSFYLAPGRDALLPALVKQFPNVTVIDVNALMGRVRAIIDRVTAAVEYVFLFTLLAGLVVLYAAIQATRDERRYEVAVLRALGARYRQLLAGVLVEFLTLGLLAGALAGLGATASGYLLADRVFSLPYHLDPWVWLAGLVGGGLGVALAGVAGTRSVLRQPPAQALQAG